MPVARGGDADDIRRPTRSHPTKRPGGDGHPRDAVLHAGGGGLQQRMGGTTEESCFLPLRGDILASPSSPRSTLSFLLRFGIATIFLHSRPSLLTSRPR